MYAYNVFFGPYENGRKQVGPLGPVGPGRSFPVLFERAIVGPPGHEVGPVGPHAARVPGSRRYRHSRSPFRRTLCRLNPMLTRQRTTRFWSTWDQRPRSILSACSRTSATELSFSGAGRGT